MKRYSVTDPTGYYVGGGPRMDEDKDGEWMRYTDHALPWVATPPTVPGLYWARELGSKRLWAVEIVVEAVDILCLNFTGTDYNPSMEQFLAKETMEWCGPLYKPE